eukprot:169659-Chlamydomonas_euryale.AAC.3
MTETQKGRIRQRSNSVIGARIPWQRQRRRRRKHYLDIHLTALQTVTREPCLTRPTGRRASANILRQHFQQKRDILAQTRAILEAGASSGAAAWRGA